jgi:hypothetical protein
VPTSKQITSHGRTGELRSERTPCLQHHILAAAGSKSPLCFVTISEQRSRSAQLRPAGEHHEINDQSTQSRRTPPMRPAGITSAALNRARSRAHLLRSDRHLLPRLRQPISPSNRRRNRIHRQSQRPSGSTLNPPIGIPKSPVDFGADNKPGTRKEKKRTRKTRSRKKS